MWAGETTPRIDPLPPQAFYARAGFLGYVAGQPEKRALVPHLDLPAEIIQLPTVIDLVAGRAPGRTSDEQTSFFLNAGAIGAQFEAVACGRPVPGSLHHPGDQGAHL